MDQTPARHPADACRAAGLVPGGGAVLAALFAAVVALGAAGPAEAAERMPERSEAAGAGAVAGSDRQAERPDSDLQDGADACISRLRGVVDEARKDPAVRWGQSLSTLIDAAVLFAHNGQAGACEETVAGIRDYMAAREGTAAAAPAGQRLGEAPPLSEQGPLRASALVGREVIGAGGDYLGEIDDVVVTGEARYVLIGTGGLLGIGEQMVPVRVGRLRTVDEDTFLLLVDEAVFDAAPRFDRDQVRDPGIVSAWAQDVGRWWDERVERR